MASRKERPQFLFELCKMCGLQRSLPRLMEIPRIDNRSAAPVSGGGSADVYQGEYKGRQVAIKAIRLYGCNDRDQDQSVGTLPHSFCLQSILIPPLLEVL